MPPANPKETEFYYKHFLVDCYSKDLENSEIKNDGDPGLLLFEFMFTVARIAVETSKEMDNAKKVYDYVLNKFLGSYLYLKTNEEVKKNKELPNIQRPFINNLRRFYIITQHDYENDDLDSD